MALPLVAAGIAARAVAKKLASRAAGGIVGAGAKQVNPVYRNISNQTKDIAKNSVKKVYYAEKEAAALGKPKKQFVKEVNEFRSKTAAGLKSGSQAKSAIKMIEQNNFNKTLSGKTGNPKVIKINSNPTRSK